MCLIVNTRVPRFQVYTSENVLPPPARTSAEQPPPVLQPQHQKQSQPHVQFQPQPQPHCQTPVPRQTAQSLATSPELQEERPRGPAKPVNLRGEMTSHHQTPRVTPPPPPVRSIESKLAAAALSKTEAANVTAYPLMMSEAASLEDSVLHPHPSQRKSSAYPSGYVYHSKGEAAPLEPTADPYYHQRTTPSAGCHYRPESVPPYMTYVSKSEPQIPYRTHGDGRYNTIGPRSVHQSFKSRDASRGDYITTGVHRGHGYGSIDGGAGYPTIRRVHSIHVPPTAIRSAPITRTEVPPPDDELFYCQRPLYHCKSYQPSSQTDYHVTQLQPYFENGRVHYRYSPYSGSHPIDASFYDVDPYGTIRLRHYHSFSSRDTHPGRSASKSGAYHYLSRHAVPVKEHGYLNRDVPPYHGPKGAVYYSWDPEEAERFRMHSIRRESRARQKVKGPVMSQYDNVAPLVSGDLAGFDVIHLRSKSDPGKSALLGAEGKNVLTRYCVTPGPQHVSRHIVSDPGVLMYMETERRCHGNGTGMGEKAATLKHSKSYQPARSAHHPSEGLNVEATFEPGDGQMSSKHWLDHPDQNFQSKYDRPDPDRHIGRLKTTSNSEDDPKTAQVKPVPPPKPERSHSMRERQHYNQTHTPDPVDRNLPAPYLHQRPSTVTPQSHYDNLDDYHPPHAQIPLPNRAGPIPTCNTHGYPSTPSNRAYSTALGQGAYISTELAMQKPETEINAE